MTIPDAGLMAHTAAAYDDLATLLEAASPSQWDAPSMCKGWRVREVIAHLTMPVRYDDQTFKKALRESGNDFTRLSNQIAHWDAQLPTGDLVKDLRSRELKSWLPEGGAIGALTHVVVHGLDVTVPLGLPSTASRVGLGVVLDGLAGGISRYFGVSTDARKLEAMDLAWAYGSGEILRGAAADLILVLTSRAVNPARLEGSPLTSSRASA